MQFNNIYVCVVDGGYGFWLVFDECLVICGNGVQKRERSCDSLVFLFGGLSCDNLEFGLSIEIKECRKDMCFGEIFMFLEFILYIYIVSGIVVELGYMKLRLFNLFMLRLCIVYM